MPVALARALSATERSKLVTQPERGEMTLEDVLATIVGQDVHPLGQLASIRERLAGDDLGQEYTREIAKRTAANQDRWGDAGKGWHLVRSDAPDMRDFDAARG